MEPEAVASGLVAGDDRGVLGESEPRLGGPDLGQEASRSRAAMVRSRGFCPRPMVKASFQVFQPSSREK